MMSFPRSRRTGSTPGKPNWCCVTFRSTIARCAPPDRYYAFADTFFAAQEKWVRSPDYREALARLAKLGGMGKEEFDTCLKNTELENKIVEGRLKATQELEVSSTPTFFINGSKLAGAPTPEEFEKLLSNLAAKS